MSLRKRQIGIVIREGNMEETSFKIMEANQKGKRKTIEVNEYELERSQTSNQLERFCPTNKGQITEN